MAASQSGASGMRRGSIAAPPWASFQARTVRPDTGRTLAGHRGHYGHKYSRAVGVGTPVALETRPSMIRDTSAQDRPLAKLAIARPWRRWLSGGAIAIAVVAGVGYVVRGWFVAERSVDHARIRIARVERGTLVRDVVADGRV